MRKRERNAWGKGGRWSHEGGGKTYLDLHWNGLVEKGGMLMEDRVQGGSDTGRKGGLHWLDFLSLVKASTTSLSVLRVSSSFISF